MTKNNRKIKVAGYVAGWLILLGIIFYATIGFVIEPYIKNKIRENAQQFGRVKYDVNFKDMDIQLLSGSIYFNRLELIPQSKPMNITDDNFRVVFERLSIIGLDFFTYLFNNKHEIEQVKIDNCKILIYKYVHSSQQPDTSKSNTSTKINIKSISINSFDVNHGHITIYNVGKDAYNPLFTGEMTIKADNIFYKYGENWQKELRYSNLRGVMNDLEAKTTDSIRLYNIQKLEINGNHNMHHVVADSFRISTRAEKYALADILGHEGDYIDVDVPKFEVQNWKVTPLLLNLSFTTESIEVYDPQVFLFTDKRAPSKKKVHELPYDFIKNLKTSISIDTLNISGGTLTYQEHAKAMDEPGYITFNNFHASIRNMTNDSSTMEKNGRKAYMYVNMDIMNVAPFDVDFTFDLRTNTTHTAKGNVGMFNLEKLNPMISQVGYMKIKSGTCHSLDFNFTYDEQKATGEAIFKYENLEVETISRNTGSSESFSQDIKTFLADFVIDDENMGSNPKVGKISHPRNPNKSTVNYWWKSLLTGIKSSVGLPAKAGKK